MCRVAAELLPLFLFKVLLDGASRKEEAAPDWVYLHSSVQPAHDHRRLSPGRIVMTKERI